MLIIGYTVLQAFKREFGHKGIVEIVDCHDDLYRLMPNGDIYVHWCGEGKPKYTQNGAFIGNLLKGCPYHPELLIPDIPRGLPLDNSNLIK